MYKLLIVDDEKVIRDGLVSVVDWAALGFTVVGTERNGLRALEFMAGHDVDVILADIRMSRMSGLDLSLAVAEKYPGVKVVILSGYDHFEYAREAIRSGVVFHYLLKPCRETEIREVFSRLAELLAREKNKNLNSERLRELEIRDLFLKLTKEASSMDILRFAGLADCPAGARYRLLRLFSVNPPVGREEPETELNEFFDDLPGYRIITGTPARQGSVFLICCCGADNDERPDFIGILESFLQQSIRGNTILLSREFGEINCLPLAMDEISQLLDNEVFFTPNTVFYSSAAGDSPALKTDFSEKAAALARFLFIESKEARNAAVESLFKNIRETFSPSREILFRFFGEFLSRAGGELQERAFSTSRIEGFLEICRSRLSHGFFVYEIQEAVLELGDTLQEETGNSRLSTAGALVAQAVRILKEEYPSGIGLNQTADRLAVTPVYLSRIFKQEKGQNFKDYLTCIRMEKAAELLTSTNDKVYQIADNVGFRDTRYFSELFKRVYKVSPLEYRNLSVEPAE